MHQSHVHMHACMHAMQFKILHACIKLMRVLHALIDTCIKQYRQLYTLYMYSIIVSNDSRKTPACIATLTCTGRNLR